jgi:Domain of Unknown Function (DUF928)
MLNSKTTFSALFLAVMVGGLGASMVGVTPAQAAPQATRSTKAAPVKSGRRVFQPVGSRMPADTVGGGSRSLDRCPLDSISNPVTLLTPKTLGERTGQERPTLLAYVEQTSAKRMFFSIQDEEGKYHYQTMLPTPTQAGLVKIQMPASSEALEPGRRYRWSVVLSCGNRLRPDSPRAESWIERVNLASAIPGAPQAQVDRLWSQNLWYDTVSTLADIRRANPGDRQSAQLWTDLLGSVGLSKVESAPFVN